MSQSKVGTLIDHVNDATDRLVSQQVEMIRLASNKEKDLGTTAAETAAIDACASSMIRAAEDLLVVTRSLKEGWILGQLRKAASERELEEEEKRIEVVGKLAEKLSE